MDQRGEHYVIQGGEVGYERLQVLARNWAPTTNALLDRVGLEPGMSALDLGWGAGDVTFELARRVGPSGRVLGVDMDEVKIGLARERAAAEDVTNIEFQVLSVYDWAETNAFDIAYCRNVLQHLSRPVDLLRTMWAAVHRGGVVVAEDADFEGSFCYPPNPAFDFWVRAYQSALRSAGGDPLSGRRLHERFVEAGLPAPELSVVQRVDVRGEPKSMPYRTIATTAETILSEGIASRSELDDALAGLAALAADESTLVGSPRLLQAWARKPATP
jgi:ubiquinone/menaquinone biosynthesis C-methylase UbiE